MNLHPEILRKDGKEFAILPWEEFLHFREMIEDAEDLLALRAAKAEEDPNAPRVSLDEIERQIELRSPK